MKTFLKIFFGLFILLVIAVAVFLYTFNANDYKKELTEVAEKIAGRSINIDGDIDISLYPLIGIKIDKVTIENPPGFSAKTFATIGQFDIKIEIIPLLQKRLNIEKLVLNRLNINFEKNATGENNWKDFTKPGQSDSVESKFGLAGLHIGGIEVEDANISWLDVNEGKEFKVTKMKLGTEAVIKGQPLPVTFNAYVKSNKPEWQGSAFVKTNLEFSENSPVFHAGELKLVIKAQMPESDLGEVTVAMIAEGEVNVQTKKAKLLKAKLSVLGLVMSGELDVENIFSVPTIHGPLKVKTFEAQELARRLNVTLPAMVNEQSLKNISLKTDFKTDFSSVYLDDITAEVDESKVNGFIHITDVRQPVISYDLNIDKINMNDYKVVESESDNEALPLLPGLIRSSDLEGSLNVEVVTIDKIDLEKLHITSSIKNGTLKASPVTMLVGGSEVKATMDIDATEIPTGDVTIEANNLDAKSSINPQLKAIMGDDAISLEGMVNASASFQVTGESVVAMKRSATGTVKVSMDKAIVRGIDLDHTSRSIVADYANKNNFKTRKSYVTEYKPDRETEFDSLSATFKLSRGKLTNTDLLLVSENANITGSGDVDFTNRKVSYRPVIDINLDDAIDIRDKLRNHPMEYNVQGGFGKLLYKFDVDKYELLVGRLLIQEAKERSIRQGKQSTWKNFKSE